MVPKMDIYKTSIKTCFHLGVNNLHIKHIVFELAFSKRSF